MEFILNLFEWLYKSSIYSSIMAGFIITIKHLFRKRISVRNHYMIWFIFLIYLCLPFIQITTSLSNPIDNSNGLISTFNLNETVSSEIENNNLNENRSEPNNKIILIKSILGIWIIGAFSLFLFYCIIYIRLKHKFKNNNSIIDPSILNVFEQCKKDLGITKKILLQYGNNVIPAVFGFISPKIIIPKQFSIRLSEKEMYYIFMHELTHIKRHDSLTNGLILLLQIVHWFNPLLWITFGKVRLDQEISCDTRVLDFIPLAENKKYGNTLINASYYFDKLPLAIGFSGILSKQNNIKRRIIMVSNFTKNCNKRRNLVFKMAFVLMGMLFLTTKISAKGSADIIETTTEAQTEYNIFDGTYSIVPGFRTRVFDNKKTYSLAFWIEGISENWDNISSIILKTDQNILFTVNGLPLDEEFYSAGYLFDGNLLFIQHFSGSSNFLYENPKLEITSNDGEILIIEDFPLMEIEGEVGIVELENIQARSGEPISEFHFFGIESNKYYYTITIFGPDQKRIYYSNIDNAEASHSVDFSTLPEGPYNIGISKHLKGHGGNMLSREYYAYW